MGWATLWAIFSQTDAVPLISKQVLVFSKMTSNKKYIYWTSGTFPRMLFFYKMLHSVYNVGITSIYVLTISQLHKILLKIFFTFISLKCTQ
jgi:hypothetical protein